MRQIGLEIVKACEQAAVATFNWIGQGAKDQADQVAVDAMRSALNQMNAHFEIAIGEGEIDDAPMLYVGEQLGNKNANFKYDVAVDPIEGTTPTAKGQSGAISVMAVAKHGSLLRAPDMYMEKLMVGSRAAGAIDIDLPLDENLRRVATRLGKQPTVMILDKPRHHTIIAQLRRSGFRVLTPEHGDVLGSLSLVLEQGDIDVVYGIGGAPEGVVSAAALKILGGDMQAKLRLRTDVKGDTAENTRLSRIERERCELKKIMVDRCLTIDDLVQDELAVFVATGITHTEILPGVQRRDGVTKTYSVIIDGYEKSVRYCETINHND